MLFISSHFASHLGTDDASPEQCTFFHNYLVNFIIWLRDTDPWFCQVSWCWAAKLCIHSSCSDVGDTEPLLAQGTDLSSALCLTPSAAGFRIQKRSAKLGSVPEGWDAGSRRPLCTSSSSVRLPDHIQDLHHLLIDDENYGHIQTHPAQPRNCPFVETTDRHKEREGEYKISMISKRLINWWHLYIL